MRGEHRIMISMPCVKRGIIPACAGNTTLYPNVSVMTWDHPRMRGEHMAKSTNCCKSLGSSPHVRGTRLYYGKQLFQQGIIPACAGNTRSASWRPPNCRDHPRMRGEHMRLLRKPSPPQGSSPHARGTRTGRANGIRSAPIIPACAGNTVPSYAGRSCSGDHPRMRGEHVTLQPRYVAKRGSSPHARGTRFADSRRFGIHGIIPACAGNTRSRNWLTCSARDHPRMRGEHGAGDC